MRKKRKSLIRGPAERKTGEKKEKSNTRPGGRENLEEMAAGVLRRRPFQRGFLADSGKTTDRRHGDGLRSDVLSPKKESAYEDGA